VTTPANTIGQLAERAHAAGVVGAGGGGFSLADKLTARPYRTLIINAAQSEPLICKDWAVLAHYPHCVCDGARLLSAALGLGKVFLAVRDEFLPLLPDLAAVARQYGVQVARLPDLYPAGYEKVLKRELLGLPMNTNGLDEVLVINAETLRNLSWAVSQDRPLTTKLLTIAGAVAQPLTLEVPIGLAFADCLRLAGGASCNDYVVFHNGVLCGQPVDPACSWVSATTLGYVLLPATHSVNTAHAGFPPGPATDLADISLAARRHAFLTHTAAGRTQTMSAAYALFDLGAYRRARPLFHALKADAVATTRVRITAGGKTRALQPAVAVGDQVRRAQVVAYVAEASSLPLHASIDGTVEHSDSSGIGIRGAAGAAAGAAS